MKSIEESQEIISKTIDENDFNLLIEILNADPIDHTKYVCKYIFDNEKWNIMIKFCEKYHGCNIRDIISCIRDIISCIRDIISCSSTFLDSFIIFLESEKIDIPIFLLQEIRNQLKEKGTIETIIRYYEYFKINGQDFLSHLC